MEDRFHYSTFSCTGVSGSLFSDHILSHTRTPDDTGLSSLFVHIDIFLSPSADIGHKSQNGIVAYSGEYHMAISFHKCHHMKKHPLYMAE
jgi:hypothetical protein